MTPRLLLPLADSFTVFLVVFENRLLIGLRDFEIRHEIDWLL